MTKDELKKHFINMVRDGEFCWRSIEPYLDESKFISQDEQEFNEWLNKFHLNKYMERVWNGYAVDVPLLRKAWMAARGK